MPLESKIQTKIINYLNQQGFIPIRLIKTNLNGIADLLAIKGKSYLFIEVKQEHGVESPLQSRRRKQFQLQGSDWIVVYGYEDFLTKFQEYAKHL